MKKWMTVQCLMFLGIFVFAQSEKEGYYYSIQDVNPMSISQADLQKAQTLSDLFERYPATWVKTYLSVELTAVCDGKLKKATSTSIILTSEQRQLLQTADNDSEVEVHVDYIPENNLKQNDPKSIDFSVQVLPAVPAQYPGGKEKMMQYLAQQIVSKIPESTIPIQVRRTAVQFMVNTEGVVYQVKTTASSSFETIDALAMEAICGMPKWIPAKDSKQRTVPQVFKLVLGNSASCL